MYSVSIPKMIEMLKATAVEEKDAMMIWGPPGIGKSESIAQLAAEYKAPLIDIRLSQYDSVDLRGIPSPEDGTTVWNVPSTLPFTSNKRFAQYSSGVIFLFLDELNSATPATLAVCYQLINDRAVGEHKLMDNVVVIAAGNRDGDKGVTNRMPLPLANRFIHTELVLDVQAWTLWAQSAGLPPVGIAYFNWRKDKLNSFDPSSPEKAFCTPRTAAKALKYLGKNNLAKDVKQAIMAGLVGDGVAAEIWGFVDTYSKITPLSEILKDPKKAEIPKEESMRYAMAVSLSSEMDRKTVGAIHTYVSRMAPEYVLLCWQLALAREKAAGVSPKDQLYSTAEFVSFAKDYGAVLA